jgi:hypothetical protein
MKTSVYLNRNNGLDLIHSFLTHCGSIHIFIMKKTTLFLLSLMATILQMAGQCTSAIEITTYTPAYCDDQFGILTVTPTVNCPEAVSMKIKWKKNGILVNQYNTTDFIAPITVLINSTLYTGAPTTSICCEIYLFDSNNVEISTATACQEDVFIPTPMGFSFDECEGTNGCFTLHSSAAASVFTIEILNESIPPSTVSPGEFYCFPYAGEFDLVVTNQDGCTMDAFFIITEAMVDSLHDVKGHLFYDADANGYWSLWTETTVPSVGFITLVELNLTTPVQPYGYFVFNDIPEGDYTYTFTDPDHLWILSTDNIYTHNSSSCDRVHIGAIPDFDYMNQASYPSNLWSNNAIHCENGFSPGLWLSNAGNLPLNGTITMTFDTLLVPEYLSGAEPYDSYANGSMVWNIENMLTSDSRFYQCHIQGPGFSHFNEIFDFEINMVLYDNLNEVFLDTTWYLHPQVICSFDPNDKAATPEGYAEPHYILAEDEIEYKIRFQNTGNAPANNVEIIDSLDVSHLDLNTFEVILSSHEMNTIVDPDGVVHFQFDNINLPDSVSDEPGSHGFVVYRIKPNANIQGGDEVNNTAYIYFDSNPAIVTNTTYHTIYDCAWMQGLPEGDIFCEGEIIIGSWDTTYVDTYAWTLDGVAMNATADYVDLSNLQNGIYTLGLTTTNPLCSHSSEMVVSINANPTATIEYDINTGTISGSGNLEYHWYINGELSGISGNEWNAFQFASIGDNIQALVLNQANCTTWTNTITVTTGIEETDQQFISLFPNPLTENSTLKLSEGIWHIQLYNSMGQKTREWSNVRRSMLIQSEALSNGTYFLKAIHQNGNVKSVMIEVRK